MTRLVCEGVKVRVDDVWAGENNGRSFYVDIANFEDLLPKDGEEVTEEQMKQYRSIYQINESRQYTSEIKDRLIEASWRILEKQKEQGIRPKGRTVKLLAEMTGISENYCQMYYQRKKELLNPSNLTEEELRRKDAIKAMNRIRVYMNYLTERLQTYDWENECPSLTREREMAEKLIDLLQKTIIEGDEKMKKMSVDYLLEDGQCAYLDEIHSHYPDISEEDLFLMIMVEGSAMDIDRHMRDFSKEHGIPVFTLRRKAGTSSDLRYNNDMKLCFSRKTAEWTERNRFV